MESRARTGQRMKVEESEKHKGLVGVESGPAMQCLKRKGIDDRMEGLC